jgi:uncharacterized protein (DUF433 family)
MAAMAANPEQDLISFTLDQVLGLTGISRRQLTYWIETDVVRPRLDVKGRSGKVRLFTFADLLEVRVAAWLRDLISLQYIRRIVERLREEGPTFGPLASVRFGVFEHVSEERTSREIVMQRPDGSWESTKKPGQLILELDLPLRNLREELETSIARKRTRRGLVGKVERRRGVMGSTPVLAGTRVPTSALWRLHNSGYGVAQILESYPGLTAEDVRAALEDERRRRQPA